MLPQKYVRTIFVAPKQWILEQFSQHFQELACVHKILLSNYSGNYECSTLRWGCLGTVVSFAMSSMGVVWIQSDKNVQLAGMHGSERFPSNKGLLCTAHSGGYCIIAPLYCIYCALIGCWSSSFTKFLKTLSSDWSREFFLFIFQFFSYFRSVAGIFIHFLGFY